MLVRSTGVSSGEKPLCTFHEDALGLTLTSVREDIRHGFGTFGYLDRIDGAPRPPARRSALRRRTAPLLQCENAVRLSSGEALPLTAGPLDFDPIVADCSRKAEVKTRIVLGQEARSGLHFSGTPLSTRVNIHLRADR